jgi:hypothetical protein
MAYTFSANYGILDKLQKHSNERTENAATLTIPRGSTFVLKQEILCAGNAGVAGICERLGRDWEGRGLLVYYEYFPRAGIPELTNKNYDKYIF